MLMKKIFAVILILSTIVSAQGGSVYSKFGVGDLIYSNSARSLGLGNITVASPSENYIDFFNPASIYRLSSTRFELGLNYNGIQIENNIDKRFYSQYSFSGFTLAIPIEKELGIVSVLGLVPVSRLEYEVVSTESFDYNGTVKPFDARYSGSGGLSKIFIGLSYKLPFNYTLGFSYEYYTGKTENISTADFETLLALRDVEYVRKNKYSGAGATFGILSPDLSNIFNSKNVKEFRFGASVNIIGELKNDTSLTSVTSIGELQFRSGSINTKLPYRFGLGTSLILNEKYMFMLNFLHQKWSDFQYNSNIVKFNDVNKFSLAVEYDNPEKRFASSLWEQIDLRGGLSFEQTQYSINGEDIMKYSIFAGFSIPFGGRNSIDFGFEYGVRGVKESGLLKENLFNAAISISFGEIWFIRQDR